MFRLAGDLVHLLSIILLFVKMSKTRSCSGKQGEGERVADSRCLCACV